MKKNLLSLGLISLLSLGVASCGDKGEINKKESSIKTSEDAKSETEYSISVEEEKYGLIPDEVLNANCDIDLVVYIEGQNNTIKDIGNYYPGSLAEDKQAHGGEASRKYHAEDVTSVEMAKFFGAASAFKTLAPGVKINLIYCSINEFNETIRSYNSQKGHLPHIMWYVNRVSESLQNGYCTDLSIYQDSQYYQQYNEYCLSRFNFGGFQTAFPFLVEPWGMLVNIDQLEEASSLFNKATNEYDECTDEYKEWVDNLTWDNFVKAVKATNMNGHAGISNLVADGDHDFFGYSLPSIYKKYCEEGKVDLTSPEADEAIKKVLKYEDELSAYTAFNWSSSGNGQNHRDEYPNVEKWKANENFMADKSYTFFMEEPWRLTSFSLYKDGRYNTDKTVIDTRVDMLPYPKIDESYDAYSGVAVEGLIVGNQCPIGQDGKEHCYSANSKLETDVAAYFTMFMGLDPRAIEARSKVKYIHDGIEYVGNLTLPIVKKDTKYDWQYDENMEDPAKDFDDNWEYNLYLWLKLYDLYVIGSEEPDTKNFTNIMYGVTKMLDSLYMINSNKVTAIDFKDEPVLIPNDGGEPRDIFEKWSKRYTIHTSMNDGIVSGQLGISDYFANMCNILYDIENDINTNSDMTWGLLQESIDTYYGEGLYDVFDRSYRNSYEGH